MVHFGLMILNTEDLFKIKQSIRLSKAILDFSKFVVVTCVDIGLIVAYSDQYTVKPV